MILCCYDPFGDSHDSENFVIAEEMTVVDTKIPRYPHKRRTSLEQPPPKDEEEQPVKVPESTVETREGTEEEFTLPRVSVPEPTGMPTLQSTLPPPCQLVSGKFKSGDVC